MSPVYGAKSRCEGTPVSVFVSTTYDPLTWAEYANGSGVCVGRGPVETTVPHRYTSSCSYAGRRPVSPGPAEEQSEWARQEQEVRLCRLRESLQCLTYRATQMMIRQQDRTIDTIAGTLSTLAQQAGLMGQEIGEHNE